MNINNEKRQIWTPSGLVLPSIFFFFLGGGGILVPPYNLGRNAQLPEDTF